MCLQLSGGRLLPRYRCSRPGSLGCFPFLNREAWKFSFSGHPQAAVVTKLRPLGGSTERAATALPSASGASSRLLIPLARVRSASPFPLRKDHSEACCAFADCFSSGSNFLPKGLLFFFFKEKREYFLPHLYFGMRQPFIIPFVISCPLSLYTMWNCVEMIYSLWRKGFNSPFDHFLLLEVFLLPLGCLLPQGTTTSCLWRKEL